MNSDPIAYLTDAISRVEAGALAGSHVAGIFGKAARSFEKEIRSYTLKVVRSCSLNYESDLRYAIKGPSSPSKLTLGNVIALIEESSRQNKSCVSAKVPGGWKMPRYIDALRKINDAWVEVKHGDEVPTPVLLTHMKSMLNLYQLIQAQEKGA